MLTDKTVFISWGWPRREATLAARQLGMHRIPSWQGADNASFSRPDVAELSQWEKTPTEINAPLMMRTVSVRCRHIRKK